MAQGTGKAAPSLIFSSDLPQGNPRSVPPKLSLTGEQRPAGAGKLPRRRGHEATRREAFVVLPAEERRVTVTEQLSRAGHILELPSTRFFNPLNTTGCQVPVFYRRCNLE